MRGIETLEKVSVGPDTNSVERIWHDVQIHGKLRPETRFQIVDEEKTHAAEILALKTKRAIIPREYRLAENDLEDIHGCSLRSVIEGGIAHAEQMAEDGVLGASWELERRKTELLNFDLMLGTPVGKAFVEWSPTDMTKSEAERKAQGYNHDSLVRVTVRESMNDFTQYNIVLPISDLDKLNDARRYIDPTEPEVESATEMLAGIQILDLEGKEAGKFMEEFEADLNLALFNSSLGQSVLKMIRGSRQRRVDAWKYVAEQDDIFETLVGVFESQARQLPASEWKRAANMARGGAWQIILERFDGGKTVKVETAADISGGSGRAAAAGAVFTACGGSVDMRSVLVNSPIFSLSRLIEVQALVEQICGYGSCQSCHSYGRLYGCGVFCHGCNKAWCEEYVLTGQQLEPKDLLWARYTIFARPQMLV